MLLLRTVDSLQRLYDMTMDVHARYRTEAHKDVVCRFNERFLLSLKEMPHCTGNCSYIFGTVAVQPPQQAVEHALRVRIDRALIGACYPMASPAHLLRLDA